jgi:hypothetical protein
MIHSILEEVDVYTQEERFSFFIMEPEDYPCFLQIAKLGESYILDIPTSILIDDEMSNELKDLLSTRFRKEIQTNEEPSHEGKDRIVSYQVRFKACEVNKMCYVAREILEQVLLIDSSKPLRISMR